MQARALKPRLMAVSEGTHEYMADRMQIERELTGAMKKMDSKRFESVLHPIFQVGPGVQGSGSFWIP